MNHMYSNGIKGVEFAICNTDSQSLELSPVPNRIQLGGNLTEGRGAGSNPEVGRNAAIENIEEIKSFLEKDTKMVFVTAGMGGGTGTGAAPIIAKTAKELGILTVGIVTTPFTFEGVKRKHRAVEGIEELKENVDTLLVISNEKLREMYGNLPLRAAFSHADDILSIAAKGIAEIITVPGYVNVDFEDVKTVMANSGVAIMGTGTASGEERAMKAVEKAIKSPLLDENNIHGAKFILLNITSGKEEILMDEISIITDYIQEEAGLEADMIWGHCVDESLGDEISVTLITTAFEGTEREVNKEKKNKATKVLEEKAVAKEQTEQQELFSEREEEAPQLNDERKLKGSLLSDGSSKEEVEPRLKLKPHKKEKERESVQEKALDYGKASELHHLENVPAYQRRKVRLDKVSPSSESEISRYTLTEEEKPEVKMNNKFLHDNVD